MKHLQGLTRLKELWIGSSEWQDITSPVGNAGLAHLKGLQSLETLCLDDTQITDSGLAELAALPELQNLSLNRTRITDVGLAHLKALKKLKKLELEGTWVTDADVLQLQELKGMQDKSPNPGHNVSEIKLENTYVTEAGADKLRLLLPNTSIQWSEADGLESDRDLERFAALSPATLEWLEVDANQAQQITDAGLMHLGRFKSLKDLDIRGSNFTDAGLVHLAALTTLQSLDFWYTNVTEKGVERLRQQLPNCEIRWFPPDPPKKKADSPP